MVVCKKVYLIILCKTAVLYLYGKYITVIIGINIIWSEAYTSALTEALVIHIEISVIG